MMMMTVLTSGSARTNMSSDSRWKVIGQSLTVVGQFSDSQMMMMMTVITSSGCHQAVIRQSLAVIG